MASRKGQLWSLRVLLAGFVPLLQVIACVFMGWKALSLALDTPFPIMVVTSESMEPAFQIGDVLFIANHKDRAMIGDLPVCWLPERMFPMIHRVIQTSWDLEKRQLLLTKGDNNMLDDSLLYPEGQDYISRDQVMGFVRFYVPFAGWPVILAQNPGRWRDLSSRFVSPPDIAEEGNMAGGFSIDL